MSDKQLAEWLEQVADGLESGMEASNAISMAKPLPSNQGALLVEALQGGEGWPVVFGNPVLQLNYAEHTILTASEKSGTLPQSMRKIASSRREASKVKRRLKLALAYPLFLLPMCNSQTF